MHKNKPSASNVRPRLQPNVLTEQTDTENLSSDEEGRSDIDSAVQELFEDFEPQVFQDTVFLPAQMSDIQETLLTSVNEVLQVFNNQEAQAHFLDNLHAPSPRTLNTAIPLGLHHPLEKSLKDKILHGEYIDFYLLLPNFAYRSQAPALQSHHEDSSPGSQRSPLTLVKRRKPVIDTRLYCLRANDRHSLIRVP